MTQPGASSIGPRVDALLEAGTQAEQTPWPIQMIWAVVSAMAVFCTVTSTFMLLWAIAPVALGWAPSAIVSDSMAPAIRRGDVVVFRDHDATEIVAPGTVIRFRVDGGPATAHRVTDFDESSMSYGTRGDANLGLDSDRVPAETVTEVGAIVVPLVGWPPTWQSERAYLSLGALLIGSIGVLMLAVQTIAAATRRNKQPGQPLGGRLGTTSRATGCSRLTSSDVSSCRQGYEWRIKRTERERVSCHLLTG